MYSLKEFKTVFDPVLEDYIDKRIQRFLANTSDPFVKDFVSYSKGLVVAGGKRLRPYLAYLMYCANGGKDEKNALGFFVALEVFHAFALVHDDIMDKGSKRHSLKTIHVHVEEKLESEKRIGDLNHVGNSQGILVGDFLLSWTTELFADGDFDQKNLAKARGYFYKMVDEVVLGQMLDVDVTTMDIAGEDLIDEKTRLKTSRYSFVRPMEIGGALADPKQNTEEFCETLGTKLGIAFQLQDDLLDLTGDSETLHKNILRDIAEHQHTFFTNYIFTNGNGDQKTYLSDILGKEIAGKEQKKVQDFFYSTGAIEAGRKIIVKNFNDAREIVKQSGYDKSYKQEFLDLIALIEKRES